MRALRRLGGLALSFALLLALPASSAMAAGASVTGDDGAPIPLGGDVTVRNMKPEVTFAFAPDEQRYAAEVLGPGGAPAAPATTCTSTSAPLAMRVGYQGNGTYTVILKVSKDSADMACAEAAEQRFAFTLNAFTAITPPAAERLLTRRPGEIAAIDYAVPVDRNPGADAHEVRFAREAVIGPDGGIAGTSEEAPVGADGRAILSFDRPGRYTVVARAKVLTAAGERFTAWSAPVHVTLVAPFDLAVNRFTDSRGPSYRIAGRVRERSVTGRIRVSLARGRRGTRFRRIAVTKVRRGGKFAFRFRLRREGAYRVRFAYAGGPTVAAGTVTQSIRITRSFG